jgi:hypothetical protein
MKSRLMHVVETVHAASGHQQVAHRGKHIAVQGPLCGLLDGAGGSGND